ncbi:polysaccharide biosynthesis tyrosine autokinase [Myxococcota bacterium]|nr:polysaccharide biosynthesis tyrosine autokinase [Myxococcota bacterium]MBU1508830.1 polysaccharide biosynthesis tyrosine autokinase [Myxococcota bacterium]
MAEPLGPFDAAPANNNAPAQTQVDWKRIFHIVRNYFWIVLLTCGVGVSLAFFVTKKQTPLYRTSCSVVISSQLPSYLGSTVKSNLAETSEDFWYEQRYLATQIEVIKSRNIALLAARRLENVDLHQLLGQPQFAHREPTEEELQRAAGVMRGMIQVIPVPESRLVNISAVSTMPLMAKKVADAITEAFIDDNLERRLSSTKSASTWLESQLLSLRKKLDEDEKRLYEFKLKNNILAVSLEARIQSTTGLILSRSNSVETLDGMARELRAKIQQVRRMRTTDPTLDPSADFLNKPAIVSLRSRYHSAQEKLKEVQVEVMERHEEVIRQERILDVVRGQLTSELALSEDALVAEYQLKERNLQESRALMLQAQEEALALAALDIEHSKLLRERNETAKLYELVLSRLKETGLAEELKTNNIRLLDAAQIPLAPFKPVLWLNLALGLALGMFFGVAFLFLLFYLDNTIKSQEEAEQYLGSSLLGYIPLLPFQSGSDPNELYIFKHPQSPIAESVRAMRTNILFMAPDRNLRTFSLTSASPLEGKTTLSTYLAISMAMGGEKTLLVDADMRRPRLHKVFGLKPKFGLSSLIVKKSGYDESIVHSPVPNLDLLPCGPIPPNPSELLQSSNFKDVYAGLLERYDRIIFDSPPVGLVTDPAIIGQIVDGIMVVMRYGKTTRHLLRNTSKILAGVKINILGGIMNYVDTHRWGDRPYYYRKGRGKRGGYYAYYSHYGSDESENEEKSGEKPTPEEKV